MGPLLADAAAVVFPELVAPLLVATVAATVLWLVRLLAAALATRPRDVDPGTRDDDRVQGQEPAPRHRGMITTHDPPTGR